VLGFCCLMADWPAEDRAQLAQVEAEIATLEQQVTQQVAHLFWVRPQFA
jgi:hypothetical protein